MRHYDAALVGSRFQHGGVAFTFKVASIAVMKSIAGSRPIAPITNVVEVSVCKNADPHAPGVLTV